VNFEGGNPSDTNESVTLSPLSLAGVAELLPSLFPAVRFQKALRRPERRKIMSRIEALVSNLSAKSSANSLAARLRTASRGGASGSETESILVEVTAALESPRHRGRLVQAGCLGPLLEVLSSDDTSPSVKEAAAEAVAKFARHSEHEVRSEFCNSGLARVLVDMLGAEWTSDSGMISGTAALLGASLPLCADHCDSTGEKCKDAIVAAHAPEALCAVIRDSSTPAEANANAVATIRELSRGRHDKSHDWRKDECLRAGAGEALLFLLDEPDCTEEVRESIVGALRNFSSRDDHRKNQLVLDGAIPALLRVLKEASAERTKELAAGAIQNLSKGPSLGRKRAVFESDGLSALMRLVRSRGATPSAKEFAVGAIRNVSNGDDECKNAVIADDFPLVLVNLFRAKDKTEVMMMEVGGTLVNIARGSRLRQEALAASGARAILNALLKSASASDVPRHIVSTILVALEAERAGTPVAPRRRALRQTPSQEELRWDSLTAETLTSHPPSGVFS
jgi:Armadillo/beta-catenin-like repeat